MIHVEMQVPHNLVIPEPEQIGRRGAHEFVALGLVSHTPTDGRLLLLLLLRDLLPVPDEEYLPAGRHGASWSPAFTARVLARALREQLGVVIFHEHPFRDPAQFSGDDTGSARELLARFAIIVPERPHASVVLGPRTAAAHLTFEGRLEVAPSFTLRLVGGQLDDRSERLRSAAKEAPEAFHRQALVVGGDGQQRLADARVAVVGLGGGGSHVVQQLAHFGVGTIIGVDPDAAEESNRSR